MISNIESLAKEVYAVWLESKGNKETRNWPELLEKEKQLWRHLASWHFSVVAQAKNNK